MIVGIGCDVVELARVADVYARHGDKFVQRLLTESEMALFTKRKALGEAKLYAYLASRWAAKEAISKALGTGIAGDVSFHAISIEHNEKGAPLVCLNGALQERLKNEGVTLHVSMTDEKTVVAAFAIAEKRERIE